VIAVPERLQQNIKLLKVRFQIAFGNGSYSLFSFVQMKSNSNSHDSVYGAVIVAVQCHCESSPGSSDECSMQRQVAANLWTKPVSLSQ